MKNHIKTIAVFCFALLVAACGSDEQKRFEQSTRMVRDVYVSTSMTVYAGQSYYIQGVGFEKGDLLSFRSDESEVEIPVQDATPKTACIIIPEALGKGTYRLWIERGEREQFLSVVKVYLTSHFDVPDKEGATIKGAVFCENRGIAGVRVSDGIVTAITDENGYYWLASDKSTGYVFYSMPSGYVPVDFDYDAMGFWQPLTADATVCEQHNFGMRAVDNDEFVLLLGADLHLANKQKDIENFKNGFVADSKRMAEQFSCPVYCLFAGDMTWDRYWYDNKFTIPTYKRLLQEVQYPLPVFHLMGNHDNDPYVTGDEAGQVPYRLSLGPNYYSFDLGEAHFVVLDDIDWINTGGAQGIVGARDYNRLVSLQQMEWLPIWPPWLTSRRRCSSLCTCSSTRIITPSSRTSPRCRALRAARRRSSMRWPVSPTSISSPAIPITTPRWRSASGSWNTTMRPSARRGGGASIFPTVRSASTARRRATVSTMSRAMT